MNVKMFHNADLVAKARDVVASVEDVKAEKDRRQQAAAYREERESAEPDDPWWIDMGGDGEPCA